MAPYADLHVHTTNSDGTLDLADVPAAARRAGVEVVAITDHDRVHPDLDAPVSRVGGVTVVHGIELRVRADGRGSVTGDGERDAPGDGEIDLIGYGVDPTPELAGEVERLQRDRIERGAAMIGRVEAHLGIDLGVEAREGFGRPHVARAIADHPDAPYDVAGAFEHLIGDDGPCYVPRDLPTFERGRDLLSAACALVGLAHPLRYDDPGAALALARDLDAVERWYPYGREVDPAPVERAIEEHGLIPTGGSDAHDDRLGLAGLSEAAYDRVAGRIAI